MSRKETAVNIFYEYASGLQQELELVKSFEMPEFQNWEIDWTQAYKISTISGKKKPWQEINVLKEILINKANPALYYFTCDAPSAVTIYEQLKANKFAKLNNVSHVPKHFKGGNCVYVGSRKDSLHGRLIQHLGFIEKGGATGALYLHNVVKAMSVKPTITFHFTLLDIKYRNVTKHLEAVLQDTLNPFIGKRAV